MFEVLVLVDLGRQLFIAVGLPVKPGWQPCQRLDSEPCIAVDDPTVALSLLSAGSGVALLPQTYAEPLARADAQSEHSSALADQISRFMQHCHRKAAVFLPCVLFWICSLATSLGSHQTSLFAVPAIAAAISPNGYCLVTILRLADPGTMKPVRHSLRNQHTSNWGGF